jgi:hypothetical protein
VGTGKREREENNFINHSFPHWYFLSLNAFLYLSFFPLETESMIQYFAYKTSTGESK